MKLKERFDYMYRRMVADLPITGSEYLRPNFKEWWEHLTEELSKNYIKITDVEKMIDEIRNPYPLDLMKKPITQEGRFFKFGNQVHENFRDEIKVTIKELKDSLQDK